MVAAFTVPSSASSSFTPNCKPDAEHAKALDFGFRPVASQVNSWVCVDFKFAPDQGDVPATTRVVATSSTGSISSRLTSTRRTTPRSSRSAISQMAFPGDLAACSATLLSLNDTTTVEARGNRRNLQYTSVLVPGSTAFDSLHGSTGIHVADGSTVIPTCDSSAWRKLRLTADSSVRRQPSMSTRTKCSPGSSGPPSECWG